MELDDLISIQGGRKHVYSKQSGELLFRDESFENREHASQTELKNNLNSQNDGHF